MFLADLLQESKAMKSRHGPTISFNAASLKASNEELNLLKVYPHTYDELEKIVRATYFGFG